MPKSDVSTIMVSGICSRDFGLGVILSQDQLYEVNLNRTSPESEFRHYVSESAALEIYGKTEKQKLTSRDCLIQFFDVGINNDGYWRYNHMALQQEDVFDVLRVIYPHCDIAILTDQSSGHERKRENGLDAKAMGKYWGGRDAK